MQNRLYKTVVRCWCLLSPLRYISGALTALNCWPNTSKMASRPAQQRNPTIRLPARARTRSPNLTPGDESLPISEWSITVVKRGTHIPTVWLRRLIEWIRFYGIAGAASLEAGGRNGYLHVQAVARVRMMPDEAGRKAMRCHIKEFIPVQRGSGLSRDAEQRLLRPADSAAYAARRM